jgi:hypothetical protein
MKVNEAILRVTQNMKTYIFGQFKSEFIYIL